MLAFEIKKYFQKIMLSSLTNKHSNIELVILALLRRFFQIPTIYCLSKNKNNNVNSYEPTFLEYEHKVLLSRYSFNGLVNVITLTKPCIDHPGRVHVIKRKLGLQGYTLFFLFWYLPKIKTTSPLKHYLTSVPLFLRPISL